MRSLNEYLTWVKQMSPQIIAAASPSSPVRVVMGNEAGDMDSFASALVYAWFLAEASPQMEAVLPVLNVPRNELGLRRDSVEIFNAAGIDQGDLIFCDDFDLKALAQQGMQLTIIDHNELSPRQEWLAACVVEICDHHQDSNLYKDTVKFRDVVFPCGSATTLVTRAMRGSERGQEQLGDRSVSLLLQTVLMLDTENLGNEKTTPLDIEQLTFNRQVVPAAVAFGAQFTDAAWHEHIKKQREDISGFSAVDVMKKDLKFGLVGKELFAIASAGASLKKLDVNSPQKREKFFQELIAFTRSYELVASFVLLSAATKGGPKEILICTSDDEWNLYASTFIGTMESSKGYGHIALKGRKSTFETDGCHEISHDGHTFALYEFSKAASRKQVLPAVTDFFGNHPKHGGCAPASRGMSQLADNSAAVGQFSSAAPGGYAAQHQAMPTAYAGRSAAVGQRLQLAAAPMHYGGAAAAPMHYGGATGIRPHPDFQPTLIGTNHLPAQRMHHTEPAPMHGYVGDPNGRAHLITDGSNFQQTHMSPQGPFHHVQKFLSQSDLAAAGAHTMHSGHPGGHFGPTKQPTGQAHGQQPGAPGDKFAATGQFSSAAPGGYAAQPQAMPAAYTGGSAAVGAAPVHYGGAAAAPMHYGGASGIAAAPKQPYVFHNRVF